MISRHFGDISENINYDLDLLETILSLTGRTTLSRLGSESALIHPAPPPPTLVLRSEFYYPGSLISSVWIRVGGGGGTNLGIYHINDHFGHTDLPTHKK